METVSSCASRSINRHSIGWGYWGGARRCWDVTQSFSMCDNWPQMLPSDTEEEPTVRHVTVVANSWKWDFLKWKVLCCVLLNRARPRERLSQLEENHLATLTSSNRGWVNCSSLILHDGAVDKWDRTLLDTNLEKENGWETIGNFGSDRKSKRDNYVSLMKQSLQWAIKSWSHPLCPVITIILPSLQIVKQLFLLSAGCSQQSNVMTYISLLAWERLT